MMKKVSQVPVKLLTAAERSELANRIRVQLLTLETDSGRSLDEMESIKKLNIMLDLFEKYGKEFDTLLSLPDIADRYLDVRLRTDKKRPSVVVVKAGSMPNLA
jgi:hypothetical protein